MEMQDRMILHPFKLASQNGSPQPKLFNIINIRISQAKEMISQVSLIFVNLSLNMLMFLFVNFVATI